MYQARHLASVHASGLSSPLALVQFMGTCVAQTAAKQGTVHPNWCEAFESKVMALPTDPLYRPDIGVNVFHSENGGTSLFVRNNVKVFMGAAEVEAAAADTDKFCPVWYPLHFEQHQFGEVCVLVLFLSFFPLPSETALE